MSRNIFREYMKYMWTHFDNKKTLITLSILSILMSVSSIISSIMSKNIMNRVFVGFESSYLHQVLPVIIYVYLVGTLISLIYTYVSTSVKIQFMNGVKLDFFDKLQKASYRFLIGIGANDLYYRMFQDTNIMVGYFFSMVVVVPLNFITIMCGFTLMMYWSVALSSGVLVFLLFQFFIVIFFKQPVQRSAQNLREIEQRIALDVNEHFKIIDSIKVFSLESTQYNYFKQYFEKLKSGIIKNTFIFSFYNIIINFLNQAWAIVMLLIGASLAVDGKLSVGEFMGIYMMSSILFKPLSESVETILKYQEAVISYRRFKEYYSEYNYEEYAGDSEFKFNKELLFENVEFAYDQERNIINQLNLKIQKNSVVIIRGESGTGKTTLINLLARLLKPNQGKIYLDGQDIQTISYGEYRKHVCILTQKPIIINDTLKNNIILDFQEEDETQINNVINTVGLHKLVQHLPDKEDTYLGIGGYNLSEGEKQRIALARIFVRKPSIMILDEPTSALDAKNGDQIIDKIKKFQNENKCLVIIVTHDTKFNKFADYIIDFEVTGNIKILFEGGM